MPTDPDNLSGRYILDPDHKPIACPDLFKWGKWFEKGDRHVAQTEVGNRLVSTVFLGIDHQFGDDGPPILFETMVFNKKKNGEIDFNGEVQFRYATWDDALAGHAATVKRLKVKEHHDQ